MAKLTSFSYARAIMIVFIFAGQLKLKIKNYKLKIDLRS